MRDKNIWLITGAGRGMGVDIAQAALAAGHGVVATGRNPDAVTNAVGAGDDLLVVELDITQTVAAAAAVHVAAEGMNGKQTNDPASHAEALLAVVDQEQPPLRWVAGADAVATVEQRAHELLAQVDEYRDLSSSLAVDD